MIRCRNGSLYTGYTNNLKNRVKLHRSGRGAKYLRGKGPLKLVYSKQYTYYKNALNGERRVKRYSRKLKLKLVKNYKK
jgi:putative endonuclease